MNYCNLKHDGLKNFASFIMKNFIMGFLSFSMETNRWCLHTNLGNEYFFYNYCVHERKIPKFTFGFVSRFVDFYFASFTFATATIFHSMRHFSRGITLGYDKSIQQ